VGACEHSSAAALTALVTLFSSPTSHGTPSAPAVAGDVTDDGLDGVLADIGDGHRRAAACHEPRAGGADATASTGNEGTTPGQVLPPCDYLR
jgi:hypothetical protein